MKLPLHSRLKGLLAGSLALFFFHPVLPPPARAEVNESLKKLAPLVAPAKASEKVNPGDLKKVEARLIKVLEALEESNVSNGPRAHDLVFNTFQLEYRDLMGRKRMLVTASNIVAAWEAAREMGLFNGKHKFTRVITQGPDHGEDCVFEYIAPPKDSPVFSTDLANIRLVAPRDARKGPYSERDRLFAEELASFQKEALEGRPDAMGRTRVENLELWKNEVAAAGDRFHEEPTIRIEGGLSSSPSGSNDYRWRITLEAANLSGHPTEVTIKCYVLCSVGENSDDLLLFAVDTQKVKMRTSEVWEHEFWTQSIGKNPNDRQVSKKQKKKGKKGKQPPLPEMRGWVAEVLHDGKRVAWDASLQAFAKHLVSVKEMPRYKPPSDDKKSKK